MDISSRIITGTSSAVASGHVPMYALNGFYGIANYNLYHTTYHYQPWAQFEFDAVVTVTKVIVAVRNYPPWGGTAFDMIEAKLGNDSGNFNSFTSLGSYGSYSANGAVIIYYVSPPVSGKYLSFKCFMTSNSHILIGDLKVIGY